MFNPTFVGRLTHDFVQRRCPELFEHLDVRTDCFTKCFVLVVWMTEFLSSLFHYGGDSIVVNVTDAWEKMVLYLMVQSAYVPVDELTSV